MAACYLIVIDGLGVGGQEDSYLFGDAGSNTLGHVVAQTRCRLPELGKLGIGNIIPLDTVPPVFRPLAAYGKLRAKSAGKDSTTGHWEIAGICMDQPFPTYPQGFPRDVMDTFCRLAGVDGVLANKPASGTAILDAFGEEHQKTGLPIVYTSADSVFQVACDIETVPLATLYEWCETARSQVMTGEHAVGRVIARPFEGRPGSYRRLSDQRHDYSLKPPSPFLPGYLRERGMETISIGKVIDLFADEGFDRSFRTKSNAEGILTLMDVIEEDKSSAFVFVNLIETDQNFGHRNDVKGFAGAMEDIDRAIPDILGRMRPEDLLVITGDHGNDPAMPGTDHSREFTPLLVYPAERAARVDLPVRTSFADIAVSICDFFGVASPFSGHSFLKS